MFELFEANLSITNSLQQEKEEIITKNFEISQNNHLKNIHYLKKGGVSLFVTTCAHNHCRV